MFQSPSLWQFAIFHRFHILSTAHYLSSDIQVPYSLLSLLGLIVTLLFDRFCSTAFLHPYHCSHNTLQLIAKLLGNQGSTYLCPPLRPPHRPSVGADIRLQPELLGYSTSGRRSSLFHQFTEIQIQKNRNSSAKSLNRPSFVRNVSKYRFRTNSSTISQKYPMQMPTQRFNTNPQLPPPSWASFTQLALKTR